MRPECDMHLTNDWVRQIWNVAESFRGRLSIDEIRDAFANLFFYRWVDLEAERDPTLGDAIFAMQAKRYRWRAVLALPAKDFGTFLYEDVYPYLGSLDRVAPDISFFFRF